MTWNPLTRRRFLQSAGTLVALPLLESLLPRSSRAASSVLPQRFIAFYFPNGAWMDAWTPTTTGTGYTLPTALQPLAPFQSDCLVLSNVANLAATTPTDPGEHARGTGTCLSAKPVASGQDFRAAQTMDQVLANAIGASTAIASLQLGLDPAPTAGTCDNTYSCAYTHCVSWADPLTPLVPQIDPTAIFNRLFNNGAPGESAAALAERNRLRKSVLDGVTSQIQSLQTRLSSGDKQKLDQYLTGVRSLEVQISRPLPTSCIGVPPPGPVTTREAQVKQMLDILILALQCDLTRVVSFMLAAGQSDLVMSWLGLTGGHHSYTHAIPDPTTAQAAIVQINQWEVKMFAYLLQGLKTIQEADGSTLLDNTLVMMTTEISHNFDHEHVSMPLILAGRGGGVITPGRHYAYPVNQQPDFASLFLSIFAGFGVPMKSFGQNVTTPLTMGLHA